VNKEAKVWQFIAGRLHRSRPVMLLVVAESTGSSPGRQGFKMAVSTDDMCGSIGGGVMEVNLVNEARSLLSVPPGSPPAGGGAADASADGVVGVAGDLTLPPERATLSRQTHQKNSPNASGMICSGKQTVIFKLLTTQDLSIIDSIVNSLENRKRNILTISPDTFSLRQPEGDTDTPGFTFKTHPDTGFLFAERLGLKNELFIIGGGHCALALSEMMSKMDFYIRIFDDRPELNTIEKNIFAHEKHVIESYENISDSVPGGPNVYVVVMTLGFASDRIVIRRLIDKDLKYFGVLGSKAKMATLLKHLKREGYPVEKLNSIRTPIGIPINSQTPEEIAISIAAEIISVKNAGQFRLKLTKTPSFNI
jgi:xanthine dehydrogenase accessory factor